MKRNNNHSRRRKDLWDTMGWTYPEKGKGFFHKNHSDSPDDGLRKAMTHHNKHQRRKQRREEKNAIRELFNDVDNLIYYEY